MIDSIGLLLLYLTILLIEFAVVIRVMLRPNREPSSRVAWIVVIVIFPALGVIAYLLLGETSVGRYRLAQAKRVIDELPEPAVLEPAETPEPDTEHLGDRLSLFRLGRSINGFRPVAGNSMQLAKDSNHTIDLLVADIEAAQSTVHVMFYIWLSDNNGLRVVEALCQAAERGVECRAMADGLGSRAMIASEHWKRMKKSGVKMGVALPLGNLLLRPFRGRLDLRNHRKIVVIDSQITYCGSQNCADPEFLVKKKFAPWVDIMLRFEGPVAMQNQGIFVSDWMSSVKEDIGHLLIEPESSAAGGFFAQVIATGPTGRASAMPEVFTSLLYDARDSVVISTPYYVPNESMQSALCAAANRGVRTVFIVPERNDSFIVGGASRSYYRQLITAGVELYEFRDGLLHAKTMTLDEDMTLVGSANMDRRSFDLNFENNVLLRDRETTSQVRERQYDYLARSNRVTLEDVEAWSMARRLWNNTLAMLGPVL